MRLTPAGLHFAGRVLPCTIGRGGLSDAKREGDGATPRGLHRIVGCLYRPDRVPAPAPWALPILPGMLWSDAPKDAAYNQLVRAPYGPSHEKLLGWENIRKKPSRTKHPCGIAPCRNRPHSPSKDFAYSTSPPSGPAPS